MPKKPFQSRLALGATFLAALVISVAFQNCGAPELTNTLTSTGSSVVDAQTAEKIPFAFDYRPNQLSYMSCSWSSTQGASANLYSSQSHLRDPNVFYTFKIGAYDDAGLTLRQEFIDHVRRNFSSKGVVSDATVTDALLYGAKHKNAGIQLSMRPTTPISDVVFYESADEPTHGISFSVFPTELVLNYKEFLPQLLTLFKNPSQRINVLGRNSLQQYKLEGSLHLHHNQAGKYNESEAEKVRKDLSSTGSINHLLAITFSQDLSEARPYLPRRFESPDSDNRAWGAGLKLKFSSSTRMPAKASVLGASGGSGALKTIEEYDLTTFNVATTWSCDERFEYIIVSPQDRSTVFPCSDVDINSLTTTQRNDLNLVRRHLNPTHWIINPVKRCISPRDPTNDCYGNRSFREVIYDTSRGERCGIDAYGAYLEKDCAEFVSFCFRR